MKKIMKNKISNPWLWLAMLLGVVFLTLSTTSCSSDEPEMDKNGRGEDESTVSEAESWTKNLPTDTIKDFFIYTGGNFSFDYLGDKDEYNKRVESSKVATSNFNERNVVMRERHILYPYSLSNIKLKRVWISKVSEGTLYGNARVEPCNFDRAEMTDVEIEDYKEWYMGEWCALQVTPGAIYCHSGRINEDNVAGKVLKVEVAGLTTNNKIAVTEFTVELVNYPDEMFNNGYYHEKYGNDQWLLFDNHDVTVDGKAQQVMVTAAINNDLYEAIEENRFPGMINIEEIREWMYEIPEAWQCWRMTATQVKQFDQYKKGVKWSWGDACPYVYSHITEDAKVFVNLKPNNSGIKRTILVKLSWSDSLDPRYKNVKKFSEFYITQLPQ